MGKSTINGQFSIATLNYQRVTLSTYDVPGQYSPLSAVGMSFSSCWSHRKTTDVGPPTEAALGLLPLLKPNHIWLVVDLPLWKIRPHRRCWGVIVRMALVKGYRFTWGGGIFRPKHPVFDRSWRSPSKNTVKNSTEDTCSWTRPSKIGKRKVNKNRVFQLFDLNFLVCNIFFCGSAGGLARRRIFEFLDPFSDWFASFCDSRNTGFYSVFSVFCMLDG